jgi:Ca2+/Na+ antiporter
MTKSARSDPKHEALEKLLIELPFKEEIEENNIFLTAGLAYFFGVLYAALTEQVERYFGIILILAAIMIIWYIRDKRKEIRRKYEKHIEALINSEQS